MTLLLVRIDLSEKSCFRFFLSAICDCDSSNFDILIPQLNVQQFGVRKFGVSETAKLRLA